MNAVNGTVNGSSRPLNALNGTGNEPSQPVNTGPEPVNESGRRVNTRRRAAPDAGEGGGKKPPAAARIVDMARERYRFVMSTDGRPYAVALNGPNVALPLRGRTGVRQRLARLFADAYPGEVASQSALADAMTVLEGIAEETDPVPVYLRVGRDDAGAVVVDLGSTDGRAVVVTGQGWQVLDRAPVLFRRSGAMAPMPPPVLDGDGLTKLHALLNMDDAAFRQMVAWLVAAWIPDIPHPILTCKGEQGTGKSKAAQMIVNLIDPTGAAKRSQPRDIKAWATQAFNSWALCLDNVSTIPPWLSDTLCKAVTGDGIVDRALYTDDDVVVLTFRRVLAMTTIDAGALAGDLVERLLLLELKLIDGRQRREEEELDATYAADRPAILGALFSLLADVLRELPAVQLTTKPRMADFARVLATVDQVKSWNTLDDYLSASANVAADALEGDPFGVAIIAFIETHGAWSGTAKQLLELLPPPDGFHPKWPKDPTRAGGRLGRLAPLLRGVGIEVEHGDRAKDRTRSRMIHLAPADRATATESERLDFTEPHLLCPECDLPVDPALTAAGHLTHPSCWDPTEQDPA